MNRTAETEVAELAQVLERLTSWVRRTVRTSEWSAVALSVLDELDRAGPRRVTELTALERTSQPGMTGIVGRLEAAGLVARSADPRDGRAALVSATADGRRYIGHRHALRAELVADRIAALSAADRRALLGATGALAALIETGTGPTTSGPTSSEGERL